MDDLEERLAGVQESIAAASERSGRSDVTLVAVTKNVPSERVRQAYRAGQRVFGENRVQEALPKMESLEPEMPDARWHMIGHLQTNKVRSAPSFDLIESVDSLRLARKLDTVGVETDTRLPVLLEANIAGEASKGGFSAEELVAAFPDMHGLSRLMVRGLMTVAPQAAKPEDVRWVFRQLRELRDRLQAEFGAAQLTELSMGMSDDYQVAIEEGATMVRIGRAIFGERPRI